MAKKRIHQIAKELDIASADVLHKAKEKKIVTKMKQMMKLTM